MIAIKGVQMPSCCMNCRLLGKEEMYCCVYPRRDLDVITVATNRPNWCPLVEIEPLTDSEQRIFLSAMSREERICKELDSEKVDDSTVKKLVPIVNSIKRKVKKTLWD